eukprot:PhM_4_TR17369/c2_g3_i1/m.33525
MRMCSPCTRTPFGRKPYAGVNDAVQSRHVLAPLHVRGDHWVLLSLSKTRIRIYDSFAKHTGDEADKFAQELKANVPILNRCTIEHVASTQQPADSNDCALWVIRNAYKYVLTKVGCHPDARGSFDHGTLFTRTWLKEHLPSREEADTDEFLRTFATTIREIASRRGYVDRQVLLLLGRRRGARCYLICRGRHNATLCKAREGNELPRPGAAARCAHKNCGNPFSRNSVPAQCSDCGRQ